jgi:hypothetical protein
MIKYPIRTDYCVNRYMARRCGGAAAVKVVRVARIVRMGSVDRTLQRITQRGQSRIKHYIQTKLFSQLDSYPLLFLSI